MANEVRSVEPRLDFLHRLRDLLTGDLADNLEAPILVATLETQKNRLIAGHGPALLVVDEYQMIRDIVALVAARHGVDAGVG